MQNSIHLLLYFLVLNVSKLEAGCDSRWPPCKKGRNTVCERGEYCDAVSGCREIKAWQEFRKWMVDKHNELRNKLALGKDTRGGNTAASNMNALSYDHDLEYTAKCHINRCQFEHDKCRATTKFSKHAGQNLYTATNIPLNNEDNIKRVVFLWYEEIKDTSANIIDSFQSPADPKKMIGHFTQVVWAQTTHIGCAMSENKGGGVNYVACNYGRGGNMRGDPVYKRGAACSACETGLKCNSEYPGLCGEISIPLKSQNNSPCDLMYFLLLVLWFMFYVVLNHYFIFF